MECFLLFFGHGCIMWQAKQQSRVAQSTGEAEFCAVTPGVNQVVWVRHLLSELSVGYSRATAVYTDNNVARALMENPVHYTRMKQIGVIYFMLLDLITRHVIVAGRVPTEVNPADLGTKPLSRREFEAKADSYFNGIGDLDLDPVERPYTEQSDDYV